MAPLTNFRFLLSDPRSVAAGHEDTPGRKQADTKITTTNPGKKELTHKTSPASAVDEVISHPQPSQPPYLLPADALPLPPIDMSTLDPNDDSLGRDFSLTCIHDLRSDKSLRVPDECFLVPKHHAHSVSHAAHAHQMEPLRPVMHLGGSGRVVDQYHRAQSMLIDDCALRSLFAMLVLILIVMALVPLDWAWFTSAPVYKLHGCNCGCGCAIAGSDEEKAMPYSDDDSDGENGVIEAETEEASRMLEKDCYFAEEPAKTT